MTPQGLLRARHEYDTFAMMGGLDEVTPPRTLTPGFLREALNVECGINGGYGTIMGYERFDGRVSPSDAAYSILNATITGSWAVGNTLTGATSAATGVIAAATASSFVLTKVVGTFTNGENLQISAVTIATAVGSQSVGTASSVLLDAQYLNAAADIYRADITTVTGSGNILGVWIYNGKVYAFRNNAGGTAAVMFKSTSSGWSAITFGEELIFTAGSSEYVDGETVTQGGVSATISRVVVRSGTWGGSTAAGSLIITGRTGGNFAAGAIAGGGAATASGAQTAITLLPGGRYKFWNHNFGGSVDTKRMYWVDGVNKAHEFDSTGDVAVPIRTGMTTDVPDKVAVHKNHLFLAFGASVQHSGTGNPYTWSVVLGASEIGMGDDVTNFLPQPGNESGGSMLITTRNKLSVLYGSSTSDWNLVTYQSEAGALAHTAQQIGAAVMLDDRGITALPTSAAFGNFEQATLSKRIRPFLDQHRTLASDSCVVRQKNQYRLFFSDGYGVYMTMVGNQVLGITPVLFTDEVRCMCSGEWSDGTERIFFGSDNGYVYELDKGTSMDGGNIVWNAKLAINFSKSPQLRKRYHYGEFEITGGGYASFSASYELAYNDTQTSQPGLSTITTNFSSGQWDSGNWDTMFWDGSTLTPSVFRLSGTAENIAINLTGSSDYDSAITFNSLLMHWSPRRRKR